MHEFNSPLRTALAVALADGVRPLVPRSLQRPGTGYGMGERRRPAKAVSVSVSPRVPQPRALSRSAATQRPWLAPSPLTSLAVSAAALRRAPAGPGGADRKSVV